MFGYGFFEAELGWAEHQRRLELANLERLRLSCGQVRFSSVSRFGVWLGGLLISVGEALCARSQQKGLRTWRSDPGVMRSQVG